MKKNICSIVLMYFFLINSACTSLIFRSESITVTRYSSPDRISFQGKGAGAGMALMSSMGPVGIALGVAIDEGIAKDIRETAKHGGVNVRQIIQNGLPKLDSFSSVNRVEIKKYGFVIEDATDDYVAAEIIVGILTSEGYKELTISSWPAQQKKGIFIQLDEIKTKPEKIVQLFQLAFES